MIPTCPPDVCDAIERRCHAARTGAMPLYAALLRVSVLEVVRSVFPRFATRHGEPALTADVDAFVRGHGTAQARFLHLPTEFVRFSQDRIKDTINRALLEYEWTLFSVEIAEQHVPPNSAARKTWAPADISLNPTACLIALPFDLNVDNAVAEQMVHQRRPPFAYAVYRSSDHRVLTQALTPSDISMLRALSDGLSQADGEAHAARIDDALRLELLAVHHS
jgi:hypothetical protein